MRSAPMDTGRGVAFGMPPTMIQRVGRTAGPPGGGVRNISLRIVDGYPDHPLEDVRPRHRVG